MKKILRKIKSHLKLSGLFFAKYILNILITIDQAINSIVMFGAPDETISSRAGRRWPNSLWAKSIDLLFFWQPVKRHVISAIENEYAQKGDLLDEF